MNTAQDLIVQHEEPPPAGGPEPSRSFLFRGKPYLVLPIGPGDPRRILTSEGSMDTARAFDPSRWGSGVAVAETSRPERVLGFYALFHSGDPTCFDDTLVFVSPRARGKRLSHLLIYGGYLQVLRKYLSFRIREVVDHPRLTLHTRCGFAPPIRPLVDGKVELGNFDIHAILSRIESENEITELTADFLAG